MTDRVYLAGQALAGILADHTISPTVDGAAKEAVEFADAVLRRLAARPPLRADANGVLDPGGVVMPMVVPAPQGDTLAAAEFKAGDKAECMRAFAGLAPGPRVGDVCTVEEVTCGYLYLDGHPAGIGYAADHFRNVTPPRAAAQPAPTYVYADDAPAAAEPPP